MENTSHTKRADLDAASQKWHTEGVFIHSPGAGRRTALASVTNKGFLSVCYVLMAGPAGGERKVKGRYLWKTF